MRMGGGGVYLCCRRWGSGGCRCRVEDMSGKQHKRKEIEDMIMTLGLGLGASGECLRKKERKKAVYITSIYLESDHKGT